MAADILPLARLREREGPDAEHWEGEGLRQVGSGPSQ